jgi:hypothetical protein
VKTGDSGGVLDKKAENMQIESLAMERDGFRGKYLTISAKMAEVDAEEDEVEDWAGIYFLELD